MTTLLDIILNQHLNSVNNNQYCKRYQSYCLNKNNSTTNNNNQRSIDFLPTLDVIDNNDSLIVQVELPGVDKKDIDIEIKESILTIQGEKKVLSRLNKISTSTSSFNSNIATNNNSANPSTPGDKTTTSTTNESLASTSDLPSIEEFEEGDSTINKPTNNTPTQTTTSNKSISSEDTKINEIKKRYLTERSSGYFKRYLDLTKILYTLDLSSISTDYTNGLLTITIKKKSDYLNSIKINLN